MILLLKRENDGAVIDRISLVDNKLDYETGVAESVFEGKRLPSKANDAFLFSVMKSWSNGQLTITEELLEK